MGKVSVFEAHGRFLVSALFVLSGRFRARLCEFCVFCGDVAFSLAASLRGLAFARFLVVSSGLSGAVTMENLCAD